MTEYVPTEQQIKDVVVMNCTAASGELTKTVGDLLVHIGDEMSKAIADDAEVVAKDEIKHWLELTGRAIQAITKVMQSSDIAYETVRIPNDAMPQEDRDVLKAAAFKTEAYQKLEAMLKETPEQAAQRLMMKVLSEGLGIQLTREEMEMLSGN